MMRSGSLLSLLAPVLGAALLCANGAGAAPARQRDKDKPPAAPFVQPRVFNLHFARTLADYARDHKLNITELRSWLPEGDHRMLTDYDHYSWTAQDERCPSTMSVNVFPPPEGRMTISMVTPDDLNIALDDHGGLWCSPVACDSVDSEASAQLLPSRLHPECR